MNEQISQPQSEDVRSTEASGDADEDGSPGTREAPQGDMEQHDEAASNGVEIAETTGRELVVIEQEDRQEGWFVRFITRLGLRSKGSLRDDLNEALAGEGVGGDVFSPEERAMLQNILRLREIRVENVMVPRAEVQAVNLETPLGEVLQIFEDNGHSRMPVYDDTLDDPRGIVLIKDLMLHMIQIAAKPKPRNGKANGRKAPAKPQPDGTPKKLDLARVDLSIPLGQLKVVRKVLFVPPSMLISDLMARMQATRTQMALVIDEYGGTDGLVSLEDIVEEVVGEIEDEHDDDDPDDTKIVDLGNGIWRTDARAELEKVSEAIGPAFDIGEHGDDVETIGGLVFALAGHIPVRGEVVTGIAGFEFRVLDADPRRVRQLQIVQTSARDKRRKAAVQARAAE